MKMKLKDILKHIDFIEVKGETEAEITSVEFDSRKVVPGTFFIAQKGMSTDGHRFIGSAFEKGAVVVVCEEYPENIPSGKAAVKVADSMKATGEAASVFYGNPSQKMKVVGITGTNGKTSIATLLFELFRNLGYKTGLISTISYRINDYEETASHTTPVALKIQQLMAKMADEGCRFCFMEVSSHAIHQERIAGIEFAGAVFTNITHDHLDYHKTFAEYIRVKQRFFDMLPANAFALTNADDKNGSVMVQNSKAKVFTYSGRTMADFSYRVLETHFDGMLLSIDRQEVWTKFVGKFNASNLLAVYSAAVTLGLEKEDVLTGISNLEPVKGRFESIRSTDGKLAIVD